MTADGVPKTPEWAAALTGIAAERIRALARQMAAGRTLVTVSWSLQRAEHGEQPVWLGLVLAAMLGQIGLPGGGFGHGYGSSGDVGNARRMSGAASVAGCERHRLLHPGGQDRGHAAASWRRIRLRRAAPPLPGRQAVSTGAGGNPFHHHQDLARLREAFARPQTVVVHEPFWTATARHADIVLPSTMSVERDDVGAGSGDSTLFAMPQLAEPYAQARDDYATFAALAERLGVGEAFTEGRTAGQWLRHLYGQWRSDLQAAGHEMPPFEQFWAAGSVEIPVPDPRPGAAVRLPRATRQASPSARRAGRSRSSRRPSTASAMPTAPDIRSG